MPVRDISVFVLRAVVFWRSDDAPRQVTSDEWWERLSMREIMQVIRYEKQVQARKRGIKIVPIARDHCVCTGRDDKMSLG